MSIGASRLIEASDRLLESALAGDALDVPLERFAHAAGAEGLTLVRHNPADHANGVGRSEFALATPSIREPVGEYLAGRAPPDPRYAKVNPAPSQGFLTDYDQFSPDGILRDPFYQEFLRPWRFQWHACAQVSDLEGDGLLYISLKRSIRRQHYTRTEIQDLNRCLPKLRVALSAAESVRKARRNGAKALLLHCASHWLEFDARGRLIGSDSRREALRELGLAPIHRCLRAPLARDQEKLDLAIGAAVGPTRRIALVILATTDLSCRLVLRFQPLSTRDDEVFNRAVAICAVTVWRIPDAPPPAIVAALANSFGLNSGRSTGCRYGRARR